MLYYYYSYCRWIVEPKWPRRDGGGSPLSIIDPADDAQIIHIY